MAEADDQGPGDRLFTGRWGVHLRGHLLLFERRPGPAIPKPTGNRLLLLAGALELFRITAGRPPLPVPLSIFVAALLGLALLSVRFLASLKLSSIGLRPWRDWSPIEKSYFVQLLILANVVFSAVLWTRLRALLASSSLPEIVATVLVPYLLFGFYQEVVYRGMIQAELVRRWGALAGILVANLLYAFGPLHAGYFYSRPSLAIPMLASIFAIGLFFGALFHRSGNLWIVAVIHGIGNAYMVGSLGRIA
ncbi:MAG TPA: CPBP family intramembrane glutamic endopeptidase [Candidatus Polarisedimenticolia bacterium]|nr:CPBP family intramembrane glutamic endopeptidase [Candidatus Polarisedimenticolia bacterium]